MKGVKSFFCLLFIFFFISCQPEEEVQTLLQQLQDISAFTVTEITPPQEYSQAFQIDVVQYLNHTRPNSATFKQRFYLSYLREDAPVVLSTSGYGISRNYVKELGYYLEANHVLMGHRFFENAQPDPLDWQYLTTWQAASDMHRIRELLKDILPGQWICNGVSKGGMTSLYYRYHYPDDVTATMAYVAPIMNRPDDPRIAPFLEQVGTAACRKKIKEFQREVLNRRQTLLPLFRQYCQQQGYEFTIIKQEEAFEYTVLEYIFAFWQYGSESGCADIPATNASDQQLFDHLMQKSPPHYYSDEDFHNYKGLFYQAYTEIGYCPYIYSHLEDLLVTLKDPSYRAFAPQNVTMVFQAESMQKVIPWLRDEGQQIIYLYGGIDPWSAAALKPGTHLDSLYVMVPGANHGINLYRADSDTRSLILSTLERWLGITTRPLPQPLAEEPGLHERF